MLSLEYKWIQKKSLGVDSTPCKILKRYILYQALSIYIFLLKIYHVYFKNRQIRLFSLKLGGRTIGSNYAFVLVYEVSNNETKLMCYFLKGQRILYSHC